MYYDRQGHPIDMWTWAAKIEDTSYKIIKQDVISGYLVSTVWLGLDHNFLGGPPLIFETMIFDRRPGSSSFTDIYCNRYVSENTAHVGHDQAITWLREKLSSEIYDCDDYQFQIVPLSDEDLRKLPRAPGKPDDASKTS